MNEFVAYAPVANEQRYGFRLETSHLFNRTLEEPGGFKPHNGNGLFRMPWNSHFYRCQPGKAWSGLTRVIWELNPVQKGRGGTLFVPGSHKAAYPAPESVQVAASDLWETYECPAGSVVFCHGDVWHGGRANYSESTRRAIHMGFSCPNTAPQYEISCALTSEIRERLGDHCALIPDTLESFGLSASWYAGKVSRVALTSDSEEL